VFKLRKRMRLRVSNAGAEPCQQGFEARTIFFNCCNESHTETVAALYVTDHSVRLDAAFLNQEIELGGHALFHAEMRSFDKHAIDTDVQDSRNIVAPVAAPADPDILRGWKPG
jgi:hypothetical protein